MHGGEQLRGFVGGVVVCDRLGAEGEKHHLRLSSEFVGLDPETQHELAKMAIDHARWQYETWRGNLARYDSGVNPLPVDADVELFVRQQRLKSPK